MLEFLAQYWWVFSSLFAVSGAVTLGFWWHMKREREKNPIQAQFIAATGCLAVIVTLFQISTIVMAITSVLSLILRILWHR